MGTKLSALRGEGVFHPWGHLAEIGACEEAVGHQFSELLGKGGLDIFLDAAPGAPGNAARLCGRYRRGSRLPFSSDGALDGGDGSAALHFLAPPTARASRIFLAGSEPFELKALHLRKIASLVRAVLRPMQEHQGASPRPIWRQKTDEELAELAAVGFDGLTIGIETGDEEALAFMDKATGPGTS